MLQIGFQKSTPRKCTFPITTYLESKKTVVHVIGYCHGFFSEGSADGGIDVGALCETMDGHLVKVWNLEMIEMMEPIVKMEEV